MDERKVFHLPLIVFVLEVYDYLHPVFLPVPDVVHEEQMLRQLPYLQLGLCHPGGFFFSWVFVNMGYDLGRGLTPPGVRPR